MTAPILFAEMNLPTIPLEKAIYGTAGAVVVIVVLSLLFSFVTNRKRKIGKQRIWLSKLLYVAFLICIAVLSASSFGSILQFGHMSGYALLVHIGAAGGFVFLLLAIAFLYLPRGESDDFELPSDNRWWFARWSSWALIASGIVTAGTMFLSMVPVLDTVGLLQAAEIHRFAGLATAAAAVLHLYALSVVKLGLR